MIGIFFILFFIAIKNGATVSYGGYHYPSNRGFSGGMTFSKSTIISFGGGGFSGG